MMQEQRTLFDSHRYTRSATGREDNVTVIDVSHAGVRRDPPAVGAGSSSINLPLSILAWSSGALLGLATTLSSAKHHASALRTLGRLPWKVKHEVISQEM